VCLCLVFLEEEETQCQLEDENDNETEYAEVMQGPEGLPDRVSFIVGCPSGDLHDGEQDVEYDSQRDD